MKLAEVREKAFAMPLNDPAYPRGPYKFYNREFVVITYRTDPDALRAVVPEPLEVASDTVDYEFIRMPDSTGFGDYTETGQVIPVRFRGNGRRGAGRRLRARHVSRRQFADRRRPRDLGLSQEARQSEDLPRERDAGLHAALRLGALRHRRPWATSTASSIRRRCLKSLARPNFMIKIIPHVDCTPRICELVRYYCEDVTVKGAWSGPAAIQLFEHAMCDVARLPVREVVSASHYVTDLTLGLGEVVFDYLK